MTKPTDQEIYDSIQESDEKPWETTPRVEDPLPSEIIGNPRRFKGLFIVCGWLLVLAVVLFAIFG